MKKIPLLLTLISSFALIACGGKNSSTVSLSSSEESSLLPESSSEVISSETKTSEVKSSSSRERKTSKNRIILMGGQSNMVGYTQYATLYADDNFDFDSYDGSAQNVKMISNCENKKIDSFTETIFGLGRNNSCFGPEVGLAHELKKDNDINYWLVKVAWGACDLATDWASTNMDEGPSEMYTRLLEEAESAIDILVNDEGITDYDISAMLWMQGEADGASSKLAFHYEENLSQFIDDLRKDLNAPEMFFIDAYISDSTSLYELINDAKLEIAKSKENCIAIDTVEAGLETNPSDRYHYEPYSMIKLGELFGEQLLTI